MSIVTDAKGLADPKDPDTCNVFKIYSLLGGPAEIGAMREKYIAGGYGYGHAKMELLEKLKEKFGPMRDKYVSWMNRQGDLREMLHEGSRNARALAAEKLNMVQGRLGLIGRPF